MRGKFITLEGGEGAGKSTLVRGLKAGLEARGVDVVVTREPGGTPGAETLRGLLLTGETDRWSPVAEALLMYAARVDHVDRLIEPALARGQWVISDRFSDSTMAYQGAAGGVPTDRIRDLHRAALDAFQPDLTLVLDLDPVTGLERTVQRGEDATRFERFDEAFHQRLRAAFLEIAEQDPDRCAVIEASADAETVLAQALEILSDRLGVDA